MPLPFEYQIRAGALQGLDGARLAQALEERDRALEDFLARLPLGIVADGTMLAAPVPVAGGATTALSNVLTFTPVLGRKYLLVFKCRAMIRTAGNGVTTLRLDLQRDGVHVADNHQPVSEVSFSSIYASFRFNGDGVSHGFRVFGTASGANTDYYTDGTSGFFIEDKGAF